MEVGDVVEEFELPDEDGRPRRLTEFLEHGPLVLFFYPAAMSRGCTTEACRFRDLAGEFADAGASAVGVSADPVERQREFVQRDGLPFPLLSDADKYVARRFGVRRLFGPLKRHTFVIGTDHRVIEVIRSELSMHAHADRALAALQRAR